MKLVKNLSFIFIITLLVTSCSPSKPDINKGLIAHFPFNGNAKDILHPNTEVNVDGAVLRADRHGNKFSAYYFDGKLSTISVDMKLPSMQSEKTISWWYYSETKPPYTKENRAENMMVLVDTTAGIGVQFGYRSAWYKTKGFDVWEWGGGTIMENDYPVLKKWHHCAYTFDGSTSHFYVDGKLKTSSAYKTKEGTPNQLMLGNYPGGDQYFKGMIDEVRIYNRALTEKEVELLYKDKSDLKISTEAAKLKPVKIILDTDFGDDGDDLLALMMLHNMQDHGECEIIAVGQANSNRESPGAIDVINTYYGRPDIPIGIVKTYVHGIADQYSTFLIKNYPDLWDLNLDSVPDAVKVFRKALANADDNSVVFVVIGFKKNMMELLESGSDEISPLTGVELVKQKVKFISDMAGFYPKPPHPETYEPFNFGIAPPGTAKYYVENCPVPILFSGIRTGEINLAGPLRKMNTPGGRAIDHKLSHDGGWGKAIEDFQAGFDCTSALVAVRGADACFYVKHGCNELKESGYNIFHYDKDCGHSHLDAVNRKVNFNVIRDIIDDMLVEPPTLNNSK